MSNCYGLSNNAKNMHHFTSATFPLQGFVYALENYSDRA